eukprot:c13645_g1_i1.p2 GENE.c13645_g1_i1~~c13645_g1_i1.p2  ORF type:complete len:119 (-),score=22.30 c13645_g1_i1:22-378(-)
MMIQGLEKVLEWGPEKMLQEITGLSHHFSLLAERTCGLQSTLRYSAGHLFGVAPNVERPDQSVGWAKTASSYLASRGIFVSARAGCLRVAPHVYNTTEDVTRAVSALADFQMQVGSKL